MANDLDLDCAKSRISGKTAFRNLLIQFECITTVAVQRQEECAQLGGWRGKDRGGGVGRRGRAGSKGPSPRPQPAVFRARRKWRGRWPLKISTFVKIVKLVKNGKTFKNLASGDLESFLIFFKLGL